MNGFLTTHVLDTAKGCPAAGIHIELFRYDNGHTIKLGEAVTNADGRTDSPILSKEDFALGQYELLFHAGDYLCSTGQAAQAPLFLDVVPIRFGMSQDDHYHVPLLLSAHGFSTYRGS
ncbi:hydroxyisourate hydrolase [Planktomarina temperata]|nr:hydroxyisourate hydrolase [Planktomarina temperata]